MEPSLYDQLGGEHKLQAIIAHFVERLLSDVLIGFFFAKVQPERLRRLEFEHAAAFLGGPFVYSGRPIAQAHARHPIRGGHFARRRTLLKETLERFAVPPGVAAAWLAHQDSLRAAVVRSR